MINKTNELPKYNNLLMIISICIIYSYAIEKLINVDLTSILTIIFSTILIFRIIIEKKVFKINIIDMAMLLLVILSILNGFMNDTMNSSINFIIKSVVFYFFGRNIFINNDSKIILTIINIFSYIIIINVLLSYDSNISNFRVTIEGTHPVAVGELISIFILTNYFYYRNTKKNIYIINIFIGMIVQLGFLGSRGAFISTIITIIVFECIVKRKYLKVVYYAILISIVYILFNMFSEILVSILPTLKRMLINNIINDPSLIGGHGQGGRARVISESLKWFNMKPITGVGIGKTYSHNLFLDLISNAGIIGLLYVFILIILVIMLLLQSKSKFNELMMLLFLVTFVNRQSSFAYDAHKSMFLFMGILITSIQYYYSINFKQDQDII